MKTSFLAECFPVLEKELLEDIEKHSTVAYFDVNEHIVEQGKYIKFLPIVLKGNVKVYSHEDAFEFLLYYISSGESCIYSFAHTFNNQPAEFSAIAETNSELLMLPIAKVKQWLNTYPSFGNLILSDYQRHYNDLLQTTKQITCYNLDQRLLDYLRQKCKMEKSNILSISHKTIANDLGTSREVISRVLKKLRTANSVVQIGRKIKVL
ncbi:Crp/Fnr family transcriptional regulator [uncultured Psychroserpens sp.]|uniref:Crp/Fnr family transcriptional regulator n=1 Tax=uncultured Psychroserpens sp. TaxID=255436 RepID=UPI002603908C|nr:Crp/Fnr family transcriptional regulator [uncultured Psychroserpens sp.]